MNGTSTCRVKVDIGGKGVVSHVGLHALGSFADRLGLGDALSSAIPQRPTLLHDRGKVLVEAALVLAGGGESCADIEHLRAEAALFGFVASDSTLHRSFHEINEKTRARIATKVASVRAKVWERSAVTKSGPVFLDIDASLVEIHSENKEQTAPTYKGGFGFHPMFCFADATGEALSGVLRPGNAGSNTAADHVRVLDEAISQLPGDVQAGHHVGDDASLVGREVVCRTDSGGTTAAFTAALRARNIRFFTSAMSNDQVQAAIFDAEGIEEVWVPALTKDGEQRDGSSVCELTPLVSLSSFRIELIRHYSGSSTPAATPERMTRWTHQRCCYGAGSTLLDPTVRRSSGDWTHIALPTAGGGRGSAERAPRRVDRPSEQSIERCVRWPSTGMIGTGCSSGSVLPRCRGREEPSGHHSAVTWSSHKYP